MGTTFTYKYDNAVYTIPSAAYYIISESIDFDTALSTIVLSEGIIEGSKYAAGFEKAQNYSDTDMGMIADTDVVHLVMPGWSLLGSTQAQFYVQVANTQGVVYNFTTDDNLDVSREIVLKLPFKRIDAGADTVDIQVYLDYWELDGSDKTFVWDAVADTLPAVAVGKFGKKEFTIPANTLPADASVDFYFTINEVGKVIRAHPITYKYHFKRSV